MLVSILISFVKISLSITCRT